MILFYGRISAMPHPKAILFDLDGTLVDSVPLWIEANLKTLASLGVSMNAQEFLTNFYHEGLHYEGILEKCGASTENAEQFYSDRNNQFAHLLHQKVEWIGKTESTLKLCAAKVPLGMMTGSRRFFVDAMDERLNLSSLFSAIVTRDDTGTKMKPDPYGLLLLAERLGIAPELCTYVGDLDVDMEAAKRAGMSSCLIKTALTPEGAEKGADVVIEKIERLVEMLK